MFSTYTEGDTKMKEIKLDKGQIKSLETMASKGLQKIKEMGRKVKSV